MPMLLPLIAAAVAVAPVDYRDDAAWLCRPGRSDACTPDATRTVVARDGRMTVERVPRSPMPPADCFYVYPTASLDPGLNSDMQPGIEERGQAASQVAALAAACRIFAPVYRQVTLTALRDGRMGAADWSTAYGDVRAAFDAYLARDNRGRPFVLIGHSQGALLLKRLAAEKLDGKPLARQLLSVILPGTTVLVPVGSAVGGEFTSIALCRSMRQTGCIVTWASYRDVPGPPAGALFGRSSDPALMAGCTNPAALAGGPAPLDGVFGFPWWKTGYVQYRRPAEWTAPTRFARIPGLVTGECVTRGGLSYLAVHVDAAPSLGRYLMDPAVTGDDAFPDWGLHVMDVHLVQGDLVRLISAQAAAWAARRDAD